MTPEGKVKERVKALLKKHGVYYHMPVMNGMGAPTLDFICCVVGFFLAIEAKAPGEKATPRQELTMQAMRRAGGVAIVIGTTEHSFTVLETLLQVMNALGAQVRRDILLAHLELMGYEQTTETDPGAGVRRPEQDAEEAGDRPRRRVRQARANNERDQLVGKAAGDGDPRGS